MQSYTGFEVTTRSQAMLSPIIAHETGSGFVWWDEALMFAIPIVLAVLAVLWIARRSGADQSDDDSSAPSHRE